MASNALECLGPVKRGRPSWEYDPAIGEEICERLVEGESLTAICRDAAMPSRNTVYEWIVANEGFANDYARARRLQADTFADEIQEVAKNLALLPEHKRIIVDVMKWRAARQNWRAWGDKVAHDHQHTLHPAHEARGLPTGLEWLTGCLPGADAADGPGPDNSGVGEA